MIDSKYEDDNKLIMQLPESGGQDGGDSINFTSYCYAGMYALGDTSALPDFWALIMGNELLAQDGTIRRHTGTPAWTGDWDRGSRDQYRAVLNAMAVFHAINPSHVTRTWVWRIFERVKWKATNTVPNYDLEVTQLPDYTGPLSGVWSSAYRVLKPNSLLLPILDLKLLFNSIKLRFDDEDDIINHVGSLIVSSFRPTIISKIACKILPKHVIKKKLFSRYQPPHEPYFIADIWVDVVEKYL